MARAFALALWLHEAMPLARLVKVLSARLTPAERVTLAFVAFSALTENEQEAFLAHLFEHEGWQA